MRALTGIRSASTSASAVASRCCSRACARCAARSAQRVLGHEPAGAHDGAGTRFQALRSLEPRGVCARPIQKAREDGEPDALGVACAAEHVTLLDVVAERLEHPGRPDHGVADGCVDGRGRGRRDGHGDPQAPRHAPRGRHVVARLGPRIAGEHGRQERRVAY